MHSERRHWQPDAILRSEDDIDEITKSEGLRTSVSLQYVLSREGSTTHHSSNDKVVIWARVSDKDEPADAPKDDEQHWSQSGPL